MKQILSYSRKQPRILLPTDIGRQVEETFKLLQATIPSTIDIHLDIIIYSGYSSVFEDKSSVRPENLYAYLTKPITRRTLATTLRNAIDNHKGETG